MKQNADQLTHYYQTDCNESNRVCCDRTNRLEELTSMHYFKKMLPPGACVLDACAGCGIYAFPLAKLGYKVTAGDLVAHHVEALIDQQQKTPILQDIYQGSIVDLSYFRDNSFDAVLNLGAYYHMTDADERHQAVYECIRVLTLGGLLFVAYLNKYSNFIKYCDTWQDEDFDLFLRCGYSTDDSLFFCTTPEEIEHEFEALGLETVKNVATDGLKFVFRQQLNALPEQLYQTFLVHHYEMCEQRTLLGYSEHALWIGRKPIE